MSNTVRCQSEALADSNADPLREVVEADREMFQAELSLTELHASVSAKGPPGIRGVHAADFSRQELFALIEQLRIAGYLRRGLVIYYVGHGVARSVNGVPESQLCLREGALSARELLRHIENLQGEPPPWIALVLNACSSAAVNISDSRIPVGVLSGSTDRIIQQLYGMQLASSSACHIELPAPGSEAQPERFGSSHSPLSRAVVDSLRNPSVPEHDRNQDGIVTLHELFHIVQDSVAENWSLCASGRPEPRLQVQAPSELPLRFHTGAAEARRQVAELIKVLERAPQGSIAQTLAGGLRAQLALPQSRALPALSWDFVIADAELRSPTLLAPEDRAVPPPPCSDGVDRLAWAPSFDNRQQRELLARFPIFARFYRFERVGKTVEVSLPREDCLSGKEWVLTVQPKSMGVAAIPARLQCEARLRRRTTETPAGNGSEAHSGREGGADEATGAEPAPQTFSFCRTTTSVPDPAECQDTAVGEQLRFREFRICNESEGQCFRSRR